MSWGYVKTLQYCCFVPSVLQSDASEWRKLLWKKTEISCIVGVVPAVYLFGIACKDPSWSVYDPLSSSEYHGICSANWCDAPDSARRSGWLPGYLAITSRLLLCWAEQGKAQLTQLWEFFKRRPIPLIEKHYLWTDINTELDGDILRLFAAHLMVVMESLVRYSSGQTMPIDHNITVTMY